jgi:diadenosine tetraphosphate (Ap4A) HIT family hydrolase
MDTAPGWPEDYAARKAGDGCALCESIGAGDNAQTIAVATLEHTEVRLERRSRLPGYCVVVWRRGHVAEPTELAPDDEAAYWLEVGAVARAVEAEFAPVKLNLFTLGNMVPHLHTHVVPRFLDDPFPGGLIPWDDMFTPEPADPDTLARRADAIRERLHG